MTLTEPHYIGRAAVVVALKAQQLLLGMGDLVEVAVALLGLLEQLLEPVEDQH